MPTKKSFRTGVILMTYGSATISKNVPEFLEHVYRKGLDDDLIKEFQRRFDIVGGSPLVDITIQQGRALQAYLEKEGKGDYIVRVGMLHSSPFIDAAVAELKAEGVQRLVGIILSPQFSAFIMGGYSKALHQAAEDNGAMARATRLYQIVE